jgi:uncharacterized protein YdeI (YjbR/CyaY-like superfamily)
MKTLLAQSVESWRDWLAEHHGSESEIWLIFHKKHSGATSIDYKDALDEALCFGWVDSLAEAIEQADEVWDGGAWFRLYVNRDSR